MSKEQVWYKKGYKFVLGETFHMILPQTFPQGGRIPDFVYLQKDGNILIQKGYAWDGVSGPELNTPNSIKATLVHDALYQLIDDGELPMDCKRLADLVLYKILLASGMTKWRASLWYAAVKQYGHSHIANRDNKLLLAP